MILKKVMLSLIENQIFKEYEEERTVNAFIDWVEQSFQKIKGKCSNEDFQKSRIFKRLREEAFPLKIFLESNPESFLSVRLKDGSQNYDGIANNGSKDFYLEITCVKNGQFDLYQAKHLDKFGHAPASGIQTEKLFSAIKDTVPVVGEAVYVESEIEEIVKLTNREIGKKLAKEYNTNTILIVAIDSSTLTDQENWFIFCEKIKMQKIASSTFHSVYITCIVSKSIVRL